MTKRMRKIIIVALCGLITLITASVSAYERDDIEDVAKVRFVPSTAQVIVDDVSPGKATVTAMATLENPSRHRRTVGLRMMLYDPYGKLIANGETEVTLRASKRQKSGQRVLLEKPMLWSTADPALYTLVVEIVDNGRVTGREQTTAGICKGEIVDGSHVMVNGSLMAIKGFALNEDAVSDKEKLRRLVRLMKMSGANVIVNKGSRKAETLAGMADREGILLIDTLPASSGRHPSLISAEKYLSEVCSSVVEDANIMDSAGFPNAEFYRYESMWQGDRNFSNRYRTDSAPAGTPVALKVTAEQQKMSANDFNPCYVVAEIVDSQGRLCRDAAGTIRFTATNRPEMIVKAFGGRALIPIYGNGRKGTIKVEARSEGLRNGSTSVLSL